MLARSFQRRSSAGQAARLQLLPLLLGLMMMMKMEATSTEEIASTEESASYESQELLEEDDIPVRAKFRLIRFMINTTDPVLMINS